jgi:hypothetical protein
MKAARGIARIQPEYEPGTRNPEPGTGNREPRTLNPEPICGPKKSAFIGGSFAEGGQAQAQDAIDQTRVG